MPLRRRSSSESFMQHVSLSVFQLVFQLLSGRCCWRLAESTGSWRYRVRRTRRSSEPRQRLAKDCLRLCPTSTASHSPTSSPLWTISNELILCCLAAWRTLCPIWCILWLLEPSHYCICTVLLLISLALPFSTLSVHFTHYYKRIYCKSAVHYNSSLLAPPIFNYLEFNLVRHGLYSSVILYSLHLQYSC